MVSVQNNSAPALSSLRNHKKKKNITPQVCLICGSSKHKGRFFPIRSTKVDYTQTYLNVFINEVVKEEAQIANSVCSSCFGSLQKLDMHQSSARQLQTVISRRYNETKKELLKYQKPIPELIYDSLLNVGNIKTGTTLNICDELSVTIYHKSNSTEVSSSSKTPTTDHSSPKFSTTQQSCNTRSKKRNSSSSTERCTIVKKAKLSEVDSPSIINTGKQSTSKCVKGKLFCGNLDEVNPKLEMGLTSRTLSEGLEILANSSQEFPIYPSHSIKEEQINCAKQELSIEAVQEHDTDSVEDKTKATNSTAVSSSSSSTPSDCSSTTSSPTVSRPESEVNSEELKPDPQSDQDSNADLENSTESVPTFDPQLAQAFLMQKSLKAAHMLDSFVNSSMWMGTADNSMQDTHSTEDFEQDLTADTILAVTEGKHNKQKRLELKNTGQSYVNTKGKLISAKKVTYQDCSRCVLKCNERLTESGRQQIFSHYWGLGNYELQRDYLASHMERIEKVGPSGLSRTVILYYLTFEEEKIQICRQFFLRTLDVSEKASRIVLRKKRQVKTETEESSI